MGEEVIIRSERKGDVLLLHLQGRLDVLSSQSTEKQVVSLIRKGESNVLLDFTEVNYLSSAGMRMLLSIFKCVKDASGKLAVCSVDDGVMDVLKLSGLDDVLEVYATQDEALQRF
jgi:anti-sigma B factor antagonist/stage II sporulation protein AA (anti-sigma F factor antagonist)